jgi:hypothetical protein
VGGQSVLDVVTEGADVGDVVVGRAVRAPTGRLVGLAWAMSGYAHMLCVLDGLAVGEGVAHGGVAAQSRIVDRNINR